MNNKVLKRLRKEVKSVIYLAPWKYTKDEVSEIVVVNDKRAPEYVYLTGKDNRNKIIETSSERQIWHGLSKEEALQELIRARREWIVNKVHYLKEKKREDERNKLFNKWKKVLSVY